MPAETEVTYSVKTEFKVVFFNDSAVALTINGAVYFGDTDEMINVVLNEMMPQLLQKLWEYKNRIGSEIELKDWVPFTVAPMPEFVDTAGAKTITLNLRIRVTNTGTHSSQWFLQMDGATKVVSGKFPFGKLKSVVVGMISGAMRENVTPY